MERYHEEDRMRAGNDRNYGRQDYGRDSMGRSADPYRSGMSGTSGSRADRDTRSGYGGHGPDRTYGDRDFGGRGAADYDGRGFGSRYYGDRSYGGRDYGGRDYGGRGYTSAGRSGGTGYKSDYGSGRLEYDPYGYDRSGSDLSASGRGPHSGRGPEGYSRSADRITEDVNEALTHHGGIDASRVRVSVEDGEVTLEGTVSSRREKRMAEDAAEGARGVRDVHNRLRISDGSDDDGSNGDSSSMDAKGGSTTSSSGSAGSNSAGSNSGKSRKKKAGRTS